ncbi:MAG: hypothetical protein ACYSTF_04610 [Planctomycetota bacterium]|jgi:hypothetical protein
MDMYEALSSPSCVLNEQIARQIFDILPERGPVMVIIDKEGHFWPSDSEKFAQLNIDESFFKELQSKIDDGVEPVVTQADECSIIAAQLATERIDCGYVFIALPQYSPESTLINIDLIEILLNQINLIAKLIEKNSLLYELQTKQFSVYGQSDVGSS